MRILGIETSCDETAVCLIEAHGSFSQGLSFDILGNALYSQAALHAPYGGVFPNLAKREHATNLVPLLRECLRQAGELPPPTPMSADTVNDMQRLLQREPELCEALGAFCIEHGKPNIDAIAVTHGPGLEPALWVGINLAKALSRIWNIPIVPVNHMEGHVLLSMVEDGRARRVAFPALGLLISGGHTELILMSDFGVYERIGETRDDAAGEAFDKVARMLQLPYPGGPEISKCARNARDRDIHSPIRFTRPMLHDPSLDFSFSGLKTAVRKAVEELSPLDEVHILGIAREFEDTVTDVLVHKTLQAADRHNARAIVVGGGVSANAHIRASLREALSTRMSDIELLIPIPELATDNAIMIALCGYAHAEQGEYCDPDSLVAIGGLRIGEYR